MLGEIAAADAAWSRLADLRPIHTAVAGRARLQVAGLRRAEAVKQRLERGLGGAPGIVEATASTVTGTLLIRFSATVSVSRLVQRIADLLHGEAAAGPDDSESE